MRHNGAQYGVFGMKHLVFLAIAAFALSAAAASFAQPASNVRAACAADLAKLCPNAQPGDGSIRQCMRDHQSDLSTACKQAIAAAMAARAAAGATSGAPHN
jgi:hypothetical protein